MARVQAMIHHETRMAWAGSTLPIQSHAVGAAKTLGIQSMAVEVSSALCQARTVVGSVHAAGHVKFEPW